MLGLNSLEFMVHVTKGMGMAASMPWVLFQPRKMPKKSVIGSGGAQRENEVKEKKSISSSSLVKKSQEKSLKPPRPRQFGGPLRATGLCKPVTMKKGV